MVDALQATHRRVRPGGIVIDARPDASRQTRILARGRVRAYLRRHRDADKDDHADAAIDRVVDRGLYRRLHRGCLWYSARFRDLADLERHFEETARYCDYAGDARRALAPYRRGPLTLRRAVKFEVLGRS